MTFSSKVMSPRSISATRPSSPSAGMSSSNARPTSVSRPVAIPWMDVEIGTVRGGSGATTGRQNQFHLRDWERDSELLERRIVAELAEPAPQVLGGLKLLVCRALSWAVLFGQLLQRLEHLVGQHAWRRRCAYHSGRGSGRWARGRCLRGHHRHRSRRRSWRRRWSRLYGWWSSRCCRRRCCLCRSSRDCGRRLLGATRDEYGYRGDDEQQELKGENPGEKIHGERLQPPGFQLQRCGMARSWVAPEGAHDSSVRAVREPPLPRLLRQRVQHDDSDLGGVAEQVGVDVLDGVVRGAVSGEVIGR